jgi:hypothetical protein
MPAPDDKTTLAESNEQAPSAPVAEPRRNSAGYATLKEIADAVFEDITANSANWKRFLRTLGGAWDFSAPQIYLIHAQRPGLWDCCFAKRAFDTNKWVLKDKAEAIVLPFAITDKETGENITDLGAAFDVNDFVATDDEPVGAWTVKPDKEPDAISALKNAFRGEVDSFSHDGTLANYLEKLTAAVTDKAVDYEWRYGDHEDIENLRLEYGDEVGLLFNGGSGEKDKKSREITWDDLVKLDLVSDADLDDEREKVEDLQELNTREKYEKETEEKRNANYPPIETWEEYTTRYSQEFEKKKAMYRETSHATAFLFTDRSVTFDELVARQVQNRRTAMNSGRGYFFSSEEGENLLNGLAINTDYNTREHYEQMVKRIEEERKIETWEEYTTRLSKEIESAKWEVEARQRELIEQHKGGVSGAPSIWDDEEPEIVNEIKRKARLLRNSVSYAVLHRLELDTSKYTDEVLSDIVLFDNEPEFIERCVIGLARRIFRVLHNMDIGERVVADLPNGDDPQGDLTAAERYGLETTRKVSHQRFGYPANFMAVEWKIPSGYDDEEEEIERLNNEDEEYSDFENCGFYIAS